MSQKLYRDSKGRFVGRESLVKELKGFLEIIELWRLRTGPLSMFGIIYTENHLVARHLRQFRNKHKIYETF